MHQLVQQDVIEHCRIALNIHAQEDAVHTVFSFANKSGGMKIKIAFLFVTVGQAIRKILLAELLEDFLLVTQHKTNHIVHSTPWSNRFSIWSIGVGNIIG